MPETQYQERSFSPSARSGAEVASPDLTQVVWRPSEWTLAAPVSLGTKTLTASSASGATLRETGSLMTSAPSGIVTDERPAKVRARSEAVTMAESLSRRAI